MEVKILTYDNKHLDKQLKETKFESQSLRMRV